jgi:Peptidase family M28
VGQVPDVPDLPRHRRRPTGQVGDHFPFILHDLPAVWLFGGWHPGYHEPSDTIDQLNFSKLEKVVRLAWWTAHQIAEAASPTRFHP